MALQSDDFGFLVGKPVEWGKALNIWTDIRDDVAAIRAAIGKGSPSAKFQPSLSSAANDRIMNRAAAPVIRLKADSSQSTALQKLLASNPSVSEMKGRSRVLVAPSERLRDSRGRFTGGANKPSDKKDAENSGTGKSLNLGSNIGNAINETPDVDPLIAASKELRDIVSPIGRIVSPLGRGFGKLFGKKKDDETKDEGKKSRVWFRRIWRSLETSRKENRDNSKLKKLGNRSGAQVGGVGAGGGIFSAIGGLLENIPFIGNLFGGKGKGLLGGLLGGAKNLFKGGLKKVPILGSLLTLFGAGSDAIDTENDASLTRQEKNDKHVVNGAQTVGGLAGAGIGFLLGGPIGAIIGNIVGEIAGKYIGGWINDFRHSDLAQSIMKAWDSAIGAIPEIWNSVVSGVSSAFDGAVKFITETFDGIAKSIGKAFDGVVDSVTQFFKDKFGVDLPKVAKETKEVVVKKAEEAAKVVAEAVTPVVDKVVDTASDALKNARDITARLAESAKNEVAETRVGKAMSSVASVITGSKKKKIDVAFDDAKDIILNASKMAGVDPGIMAQIAGFESGYDFNAKTPIGKDGKRISTAHGLGQFLDKSWTGSINKYGSKYGIEGAGNLTKEQAAEYRNDPKIQAAMLAELTKENIEKGKKFGGNDTLSNVYGFHNLGSADAEKLLTALKINPSGSVKDALIGQDFSEKNKKRVDAVINGNPSLYVDKKSGDPVSVAEAYKRQGDALRHFDKYAETIRSYAAEPKSTSQTSIAPAITAPNTSSNDFKLPNKIPDQPQPQSEIIPLGGTNPQPITVTFDKRDVGQDLIDRNIAHVVTGGMSGAMK